MNARPYKPPPESLAFQALKLVCTLFALALIFGFYFLIFWGITLLHPPQWLAIPLVMVMMVCVAVTYLFLKWTTLGKYLCDWPPWLTF